MGRIGGRGPARALVAGGAVLLAAGAWAAATVDPRRPTTIAAGGKAGATGLADAELLAEDAPGSSTVAVAPPAVPTMPAPSPPTSPTTRPSGRSTTTAKGPATSGTAATL